MFDQPRDQCIEIDEMEAKLGELEDILKAKEVDVLSDEGNEFV